MEKEVFMALLNFTEEDLNMNRNSQMSEPQKNRIRKSAHLVSMILILVAVFLAGGFYILTKRPIPVQAYTVAGIFCGFLIILAVIFSLRAHSAANNGEVKSISGTVRYQYVKRYLYLCIQNMKFPVIASYKQAIPEGSTFTVYYSPADKNVLSAEEV